MAAADELTMLAAAAVHGDDVALAELVRRTHDSVRGVCQALADRDELDDVVQEVYLRVVTSLPGFRADSPVLPWMLSIARHTCADVVRRQRRRRRLIERATTQRPASSAPAPGGEVEGLLTDLLPERRLAFVLTQLVGLSYEEAAAVCECPVGTIRSRVARARVDLQGALQRAASA